MAGADLSIKLVMAGMAVVALPGAALASSHPIIIVTPAATRYAGPAGAPAGLPLELLDTAPQAMSGPLTPGVVVAQHGVRAVDALVLAAPVKRGVIDIPAGTVLAKVTLAPSPDESDPPRVLWCRTGPLPRLHPDQTDCLEDPAHAGAFNRFLTAPLGVLDASFAVADVAFGPGVQIDPVPYRAASVAERPATQVGYRWCSGDSDGVRIPFRFTSVIYQDGYGWRGDARGCPFGEWADASHQVLKVDRVALRISQASDGPRYEVMGRIAAGQIAPFRTSGQTIRDAQAPADEVIDKAEARAARPLLPAGLAQGLAPGPHAHGDEIVHVPVVHGVTGVLKSDVVPTGFSFHKVHAGEYVFGIPMRTAAGGEKITWCAPSAGKDNPSRFSTVCFPAVGTG